MSQEDVSFEWEALCLEERAAFKARLNTQGILTRGHAAVWHGHNDASPSARQLAEAEAARLNHQIVKSKMAAFIRQHP